MTVPSSSAISKQNSTKNTKRSRRSARPVTSVGIEIGHDTIYMVLLKNGDDGRVFFEKCRSFEYDPSLKLESSAFTTILKAALKQFSGSSKELSVWAAPKLDCARVHHIKIPKVSSAKLPGAVYWGLQREDAFVEDETVVDFQIEEGDGTTATLDVTGALIDRENIADIQKAFAQAGHPLSGIGVPVLALGNLVKLRLAERPQTPVLVCQVGHLSTSVSVLLNGRLVFTRNIPSGLHSLAETLVKEPGSVLSQTEACRLVLNLGLEVAQFPPDQQQAHVDAVTLLRPVLARTVRQIERTIEYYQSNFETASIEVICLGGEVAARGPLFHFISEQLTPAVIAIDPFDTPGLEERSSTPSDRGERVAYGPAFGLALKGSQDGINLSNTYKERQNEGKQNKLAAIASIFLLLLALAAALFYNTQRLKLNNLQAEEMKLEQEFKALGPRLTESIITEVNEEVRLLEERRRAAIKRYEGLALLSEITRLTPENVSLLHVSAAMGSTITFLDASSPNFRVNRDDNGQPVKLAADRKGSLLLKGVVMGVRSSLEASLTIYIARLDQSPLFNTVEVESTDLVQSGGVMHLTFTLNVQAIAEIETIIKE